MLVLSFPEDLNFTLQLQVISLTLSLSYSPACTLAAWCWAGVLRTLSWACSERRGRPVTAFKPSQVFTEHLPFLGMRSWPSMYVTVPELPHCPKTLTQFPLCAYGISSARVSPCLWV